MDWFVIRQGAARTRDALATLADTLAWLAAAWGVFYFHGKAVSLLAYAGMPPRTLVEARAFAADPFLLERLTSWGWFCACVLCAIVLCVSVLEGAWALLRRI